MVNNKLILGLFCSVIVIKSVLARIIINSNTCEIGKYGPNCQYQCHCLANSLCNVGICSGLCERGYTNVPYCNETCPPLKFGLECRFDCHCLNNEQCDKVNGDCPGKRCAHNYEGPGCQRRLPRLPRAPHVVYMSCRYVVLGWDAFYYNTDDGEGPIGIYIVRAKPEDAKFWFNPVNVTDLQDGRPYYTVSFSTHLFPENNYLFRLDVIAYAHGKLLDKVQTGLPTFPFLHSCTNCAGRSSSSGQRKVSIDWALLIPTSIFASIYSKIEI